LSEAADPRPPPERRAKVLVIGVGNRYRSDDRAGLVVVELVRRAGPAAVDVVEIEGEPISLIDAWGDAPFVYLVDAVASGAEPGSVHRFDALAEPPPAAFRRRSTHAMSLADVIELARALDRMPERLVVYGIEGEAFVAGTEISPRVQTAVVEAADRLVAELMGPETQGET
jgi:hydrogenase maturation protease